MEWDKVSDEQYWAELSSDKPLATTARTPQPAGEPTPAMARNGRSRSAAAKPRPSVPASQPAPPAAGQARGRDLPARSARIRQREAVAQQREAIAQQREAVAQREAVTERLPIRSRQQPAAAAPPRNGAPTPMRPDATSTPPAGEPSLAMLASLAGGPTGAPDDDPLTSPSFSRPALDSRSYGSARRNGQASDTGSSAYADGPAAAAGYGDNGYASGDYGNGNHANSRPDDRTPVNGAYQVPDHPDPGYAYAQAAAQVPPTGAPQRADWYSAPAPNTPAQNTPAPNTPAQGNPYGSYVEAAPAVSYPSIPPMGYQDQHAGAGLPAYPGDEAGGYAEPTYSPAASLPYPGQTAAGVAGPGVHPSGAGQPPQPAAYPEAGYTNGAYGAEYPGQAPYAEPYGTAGYTPGYPPAGYAADQYGPDDGGYPAGQG
jgi:hypothetical protein